MEGVGMLETVCSAVDSLVDYLESLENDSNLTASLSNQVQWLKCEIRFLAIFLRCSMMKSINDGDQYGLLARIEAIVEDAETELLVKATDLNDIISGILGKIKLIQPGIRDAFIEGSMSPACTNPRGYEIVVELVGCVLEGLKDLLANKAELVVPVNQQIKALEQKLRFLRIITLFSGNRSVEDEKMNDLRGNVVVVAQEAACLSYMCWVDQVDERKAGDMETMLSDLLQRTMPTANPQIREIYIQVMKASASLQSETPMNEELLVAFIDTLLQHLIELLNLQSQAVFIVEELRFLRAFVTDLPEHDTKPDKLTDLMIHVESVVSDAGHLIFLGYVQEKKEEINEEMSLVLLDFQEKINLVKAEIRKIYLEASESKFLRGDGLGHMNRLLRNLRLSLYSKSNRNGLAKHQTETVQADLAFFLAYIGEIYIKHHGFTHLPTGIILAIYQAEYFMNSYFVRGNPVSYYMLHHILGVIKDAEAEGREIYEGNDIRAHNYVDNFKSTTPPRKDDVMVGLEDEVSWMIRYLTWGSSRLTTISIVGMPGLGKTTLAKKVYDSPLIRRHFNISLWSCASDIYRLRDLLLGILSNVTELTGEFSEMSDEDLAMDLYKNLKGKRYLLVLDDMWDVGLWDELRRILPDDKNGSRILFTRQNNVVAFQNGGYERLYHLRQLYDEESWALLQMKLSIKEDCPFELLEIGKQIARGCKGLPLAIVIISRHLACMHRTRETWTKVADNLRSHLSNDPSRPLDILEESYRQLPDYLRPCFLYLGAFLEEENVSISKLVRLWIAEGLVEKTVSNSIEEEAEEYLKELIDIGVVISTKRGSEGGVKMCRVLDWFRDLCVAKAKEERFGHLIHGDDELNAFQMSYKQRRLCIYSTCKQFVQRRPGNPDLQSLLFFSSDEDILPKKSYDVSFIYNRFKKLRVLNLWSINMGNSFPNGVQLLVELRYMAIRGQINSIPSSISKLLNLETFLMGGSRGQIVLPDTIWNMVRLRHLHVNSRVAFRLQDDNAKDTFQLYNLRRHLHVSSRVGSSLHDYNPEDSSQLYNLQTFSTPSLSYGNDAEKIMWRLPAIRKLRCAILDSWDSSKKCNRFPALELLSQLESLKAFSFGKFQYPCELRFPLNLKKLTLSGFLLPWSAISTIGRLPNLVVLKLLAEAFHGERWGVGDDEFLRLKFLKLDNLNIERWRVSEDSFPCLEQLVLHSCKQLEEIPSCFGYLPTLEMIEVQRCSISASNSARQIHEEQLEWGNDMLKVLITDPPDRSFSSSA